MIYLIAGNGNANKKEVVLTLDSLRSAAGDDCAFIFIEEQEPSPTMLAIFEWITKNAVWHEAVVTQENDSFYCSADEVYTAKRPLDRALKIAPARCQPGEKWALLVLSDDLDNDESVLYAITRTIEEGAPVYDLGGQMTQITLEAEEEEAFPLLETPSAEDFILPQAQPVEEPDEMVLTLDDLKDLTVAELKSLASSRGVYPRDLRSKDSIIEALLEEKDDYPGLVATEETAPVEKEVDISPALFYLVTVHADGSAAMRPLTAEQAATL